MKWLEAHRDGAKYLVAVDGSMTADDLIIVSGQPVMDMGGFDGSDPDGWHGGWNYTVARSNLR